MIGRDSDLLSLLADDDFDNCYFCANESKEFCTNESKESMSDTL